MHRAGIIFYSLGLVWSDWQEFALRFGGLAVTAEVVDVRCIVRTGQNPSIHVPLLKGETPLGAVEIDGIQQEPAPYRKGGPVAVYSNPRRPSQFV